MHLENLVVDAVDPQRLGRFWQDVVGGETLTDEPGIFETRLVVEGGPTLDLCFQPVPDAPPDPRDQPPRLHPDVHGGPAQVEVVERLLGLGARHLDIGQASGPRGAPPWVVLADPEGNPLCVMEERESYVDTGPIAALPLDSADPERDAAFWSWLTGWTALAGEPTLRHPSRRGLLLELCPEPHPKSVTKNRWHLDLRLDDADDADQVAADITARGGRELHPAWAGEVPWRLYADPSGNDFCVLPVSS